MGLLILLVRHHTCSNWLTMYAIRTMNEIYHLVTRGGQDTLCGLRVSRISFDRTNNRLHLVHTVPAEKAMCKHCERIKNQDQEE